MNSFVAIGIDFGTTNSVVAVSEAGKARLLPSLDGARLVPSVAAYRDASALLGQAALSLLEKTTSDGTVPQGLSIIRSVKRLLRSPEVTIAVTAQGQALSPLDVSADILRHLKEQAEATLNQSVTHAVITVPAYFEEPARALVKEAARLAGLEVLRLLSEPTAAALAYGLESGKEGLYAVYDLGGGTFDFSLLRMREGVFQVLGTGGDTALGGDDIDQAIADDWLSSLHTPYPPATLLLLARQAKEFLSTTPDALWQHEELQLSYGKLEELALPFLERTFKICKRALKGAALNKEHLQGIIFVGGSTRLPLVRQQAEVFFGQPPLVDLNPEEVVALGAALQAETLTSGQGTLLLDITPLSLGIEVMGGLVDPLITRNSPIPTTRTQEFTTYHDDQTALKIHILQGEGEKVKNCLSLGEFVLQGIPPLKAGEARVQITFAMDADGLLTVSAREKTTGVHQQIEVNANRSLTEAVQLLQTV